METIELIDTLTPSHRYMTCSDLDRDEVDRCPRCHLLALAVDDIEPSDDYTLTWEGPAVLSPEETQP